MKLNYDCIRDILLSLEEKLQFDEQEDGFDNPTLFFNDILSCKKLISYSKSTVLYTSQKLDEADYIKITHSPGDGFIDDFYFTEITFSGHQYLEKIRDTERWQTVKSIGNKIGDFSLAALEKIAEGVTSAALEKIFNQL